MFIVMHTLKDFPECKSYRFLTDSDLEKSFYFMARSESTIPLLMGLRPKWQCIKCLRRF